MVDPMPNAPSLKMFCVYGVNKPVERCARLALTTARVRYCCL